MAKWSPLVLASMVLLGATTATAASPGENGRIAFVRSLDVQGGREPSAIWTVRPDGSGARRLTHPQWDDTEPAWSPDGRRIAFVREFGAGSSLPYAGSELFVMNADGSDQRRLTRNAVSDTSPTWSPDGRRLFFVRSDARRSLLEQPRADVWTIALNGLRTRRLARTPEFELEIELSPRGNRLAYLAAWPERAFNEIESTAYWQIPDERQLWTMRADGRDRRWSGVTSSTFRPFPALGELLSDPSWSPNGERLAVATWGGVVSMRPDGEFVIRHGQGADVAWSPDSRELAVVRAGDIDSSIHSVVLDVGGDRRITTTELPNGTAFDSDPDWQPIRRR